MVDVFCEIVGVVVEYKCFVVVVYYCNVVDDSVDNLIVVVC